MSDIFHRLFLLFSRHKIIYWLVILFTVVVSALFASKLKFVEDITQILPKGPETAQLKHILDNSELTDRLIFHIYSDNENQIDKIVATADSAQKLIINQVPDTLVKDLFFKVDQSNINNLYNLVYNNLPLFLEDDDYTKIDLDLNSQHIANTLRAHYRNLMSPASFALKKYIVKDPLSLTPIVLKKLQGVQFDDNFTLNKGWIVTKDKKHLLFFIQPRYSASETSKNTLLVNKLEEISSSLNKLNSNVTTEYYGSAVVAVGNANRIKWDIILTVNIAMALLLIVIAVVFKRKSAFFIIFIPVLMGGLLSVAALFLIKTTVSAVALGIGSVLLGISIDYSLHIFSHARNGASVKQLYKDLVFPVLLSSFTTASAFLSLFIIKSDVLNDLGMFAAISVVSAALFALIFIPPLIYKGRKKTQKTESIKTPLVDKITQYPLHKNKWLISAVLLFTVVMFFTGKGVTFDDNMDKMNYQSEKLTNTEKSISGITSESKKAVFVFVEGKNRQEAFKKNEILVSKLEKLKADSIISRYRTVSSLLLSDSLAKIKIDKWNNFWHNGRAEKLEQMLITEGKEIGFKESSFKGFYKFLNKDFNNLSEQDYSAFESLFYKGFISEKDSGCSVMNLINVAAENRSLVYKELNTEKGVSILDKQYITNSLVSHLNTDFDKLILLSTLVIFVILLVYYGRIELALITIIPMIISWIWAIGLMGIFGISFNIFNVIISTFIFGLGIDYSIFIMQGMLLQYKYGGDDNLPSYKLSILLSGITTVLAIGVLIFAKHPALKSIAIMSIVGICSVVLVTYTIQPILFNWLVKKGGNEQENPRNIINTIFTLHAAISFLSQSIIIIGFIPVLHLLPIRKKYKKQFFHWLVCIMSKISVYSYFYVRKDIVNPFNERFKEPAVIISNHQSHIDLVLLLMLNPKIIMLTKDWVWNNIIFGPIVRYADFISIDQGVDKSIEKIKAKIDQGFSILVFPEGTRSKTGKIRRFHNGAFMLADKLNLPILPIILQGADHVMRKQQKNLQVAKYITIKLFERKNSKDLGDSYKEQAKAFTEFYRNEFKALSKTEQAPKYYRRVLTGKYMYKSPVLEWYMKVKMSLEDNYKYFNSIIPDNARVTDIGCGYGFLAHMLKLMSDERTILGIDYDADKIAVASNIYPSDKNITFKAGDINNIIIPESDVFIMLDVLHYMPEELQNDVIDRCCEALSNDGLIIIRDANKNLQKRHRGTKLTELFSTKSGFNKTEYGELTFVSSELIEAAAKRNNYSLQVVDSTKLTSNIVYLLRRNNL